MNKMKLTGILIILALQLCGTFSWELYQQWDQGEALPSPSVMAYVRDVLITCSGSTLQFWSQNFKEKFNELSLDGIITDIAIHPDTDIQYIYVATQEGSIYTFLPPGQENQFQQIAKKDNFPYGLYANKVVWIGESRLLVAGTSRSGFSPQFYIYQTLNNGSLAYKSLYDTAFNVDATIDDISVSRQYSRVAFYSTGNTNIINITGNFPQSNVLEYSLSDFSLLHEYEDSALSSPDTSAQISYVGDQNLYVFDETDKKLFLAQMQGLTEVVVQNMVQFDILNIHQSIYIDQLIAQGRNTSTNFSTVMYLKQLTNNNMTIISQVDLFERENQDLTAITFDDGQDYMAVGFANAGQQTYRSAIPVSAFVVPIAAILGIALIVGIALLVKGRSKNKETRGGNGSETQDKVVDGI